MNKNYSLLVAFLLLNITIYATGSTNQTSYKMQQGVTNDDYMPRTIIFKVKSQYRSLCSNDKINIPELQKLFSNLQTQSLKKLFPNHQAPDRPFNDFGKRYADLSLIYELHFGGNADLIKSINQLLATGIFEYAEPKFIPKTCFTPNDPSLSNQQFLGKINAYLGWDVSKGDSSVVIGITDTGTDTDHPDLIDKIKHNYADPIDGIDNDNDGYVDNFSGWDVGENDNDPQVGTCGTCSHGSHVSGCAAANTDNGIGVASPGFKCTFLPVKIADASGSLTAAYEGITYAADHGCQIINCSWGGSGGSSLGQDVITYASINKNSLVVVAAGNNGVNQNFYPAAYDYAFAVAATSINDLKAGFSNYGYYVDICAPGINIYSTYFDNTYSFQSGTSMASPIVAGCAGIVKSYYPTYNGLQVGEQLRVNADNIYNIAANAAYADQLGGGRVNLLNALTLNNVSVRISNIQTTDNNDNVFIVNDTLRIVGDITNYLAPTTNLALTLTSTSPYVTIIDGSTTVGAMASLSTTNNTADPFTVLIKPGTPQNSVINFKMILTDGTYTDFQMFSITVNVDYLNITINDVLTTNTSKGRLCYNSTSQADGLGFDYPNTTTLVYEAGLMVGVQGNVSDNVRGATNGQTDDDFLPVLTIQKHEPGIWSDFDTYGTFNDQQSSNPLNVTINHRSLTWTNAPDNKYHIFEYKIKNTGTSILNNLYAGIIADWDIMNYANNKSNENNLLKMGYSYSTDSAGVYAGIKLLTSGPFNHYAIDNVTTGNGGIDISNGFTTALKYQALSTSRATAGGTGTGNDVIDLVSTGPFNLNAGDSITVAFALIAGDELTSLNSSANAAQIKYDLATGLSDNQINSTTHGNAYPNPTHTEFVVPVQMKSRQNLVVHIYDNLGREVSTKQLDLNAGEHQINLSLVGMNNGIYHYSIIGADVFLNGIVEKQ